MSLLLYYWLQGIPSLIPPLPTADTEACSPVCILADVSISPSLYLGPPSATGFQVEEITQIIYFKRVTSPQGSPEKGILKEMTDGQILRAYYTQIITTHSQYYVPSTTLNVFQLYHELYYYAHFSDKKSLAERVKYPA